MNQMFRFNTYFNKDSTPLFLLTKYLIDGSIGGKGTVKDGELPFQSLWDVISASSWMDHSRQKLYIHNIGELSRFLQIEEPILLHQLPDNFISHLERQTSKLKSIAISSW